MKRGIAIGAVLAIGFLIYQDSTDRFERVDKLEENERIELRNNLNALSERVDLVAYVPDIELYDDGLDDESDIIYVGEEETGDYFEVEEFLEYDHNPSQETLDKIKNIHIPELEKVRDNIKMPIIIRSGARSREWEKKGEGQVSRDIFTRQD